MNSTVRNLVLGVLGLIVGYWVLTTVVHIALALIFNIVLPIAIVGGLLYGAYVMFGRKALGPGRRTLP